MAKEYGSTVTLVRNGVELNALVAASSIQPDGEHLTVLYLDPAFAGQMLGGAGLQRAIATAFVVPLKEGAVNGWKDQPRGLGSVLAEMVAAEPSTADLDAHAEEQKIAAETVGTDGTSPSDSAPAQADVAAKEEQAGLGEVPPAPPTE